MNYRAALGLRVTGAEEGDRRLVASGVVVFLFLSLVLGHVFPDRVFPSFLKVIRSVPRSAPSASRIYPVLVEQEYSPPARTNQIRALSDVTAQGTGRLTRNKGFHTLSPHDRLELNSPRRARNAGDKSRRYRRRGDLSYNTSKGKRVYSRGKSRGDFKIPFNYRFREDIALNYDGSARLSIARERFPEFRYFQRMLRKIRRNFSPPGGNYVSHDHYGYTSHQTIKPQQIKVLFSIDATGDVRDVRVVSSVIQRTVANACISALEGRNFGPPPRAVLDRGGIIGINFIFPPLRRR